MNRVKNKQFKTIIITILLTLVITSEFASALSLKSNEKPSIVTTLDDTETGEFWIDLKPGGGHDGGKFENEISKWSINTVVTEDDFDDTDRLIPEWANSDGIYSSIRPDEDLNDGTDDDGAWCVAAAESGGLVKEPSTGYTYIRSKPDYMYLPDYVDTSLPSFEITSATLYCDYKIWAKDYDNDWNYVILNIYIKNSNNKYGFFKFQKTAGNSPDTIGNGYPGGGKCTDYWDPSENFKVWPDPTTDGKNDYTVSQMYEGTSFANWLMNNGLNSKLSLTFHLDIHLIGEIFCNDEYFKFRLDDVGIKCEYKYSNPTDYYALIIGVGDYNGDGDCNDENELPMCQNDALYMKYALLQGGKWDIQMLNSRVTLDKVKDKINNWMLPNEDDNDVSLIYHTGHGSYLTDINGDEADGKDECLVLCYHDYWIDDDFAATINSFEGNVIVILDSCLSGGMPMPHGKSIDANDDSSVFDSWTNEFKNDFMSSNVGSNVIMLMACREDETTIGLWGLDPVFDHGLFTFGILSGLNGGAGDGDIEVIDCYNHAKSIFETTQNVFFGETSAHAQIYYSENNLKNIIIINTDNNGPSKPTKPEGDEKIKVDTDSTYTTTISDSNGDKLTVFFVWGNTIEKIGDSISPGEVSASHSWSSKGTYGIRVIAIDPDRAVSGWSDIKYVTVEKKSRGLFCFTILYELLLRLLKL